MTLLLVDFIGGAIGPVGHKHATCGSTFLRLTNTYLLRNFTKNAEFLLFLESCDFSVVHKILYIFRQQQYVKLAYGIRINSSIVMNFIWPNTDNNSTSILFLILQKQPFLKSRLLVDFSKDSGSFVVPSLLFNLQCGSKSCFDFNRVGIPPYHISC